MRKFSGNILLAFVVLSIVILESFGYDVVRNSSRLPDDTYGCGSFSFLYTGMGGFPADSIQAVRDSITVELSLEEQAILDSIRQAKADSIAFVKADSIHRAAIDTIRIPDSLQYRDTFKFKYFIAMRDTMTRREVRDSLRSIGDTLTLERFDSLVFLDSSQVAAYQFAIWYKSLSRSERKKYDYEQALPALLHRSDSILARKDSLQKLRDSTIAATHMILSTYALPDSMLYKRILMWKHDQYFNDIKLEPIDTSFNDYFYDYPFLTKDVNGSYLGVIGSPTQYHNYFKREEEENAIFYTPNKMYSYSPADVPSYNTKTPYTELAYWGTLFSTKTKEEDVLKLMTTQNILPELNLHLEYRRWGGKGIAQNEETNNRTAVVAMNYIGKRYLAHFGYLYNHIKRTENGGLVDNDNSVREGFNWIRDTTVDAREIPVRLSSAYSELYKRTVFLDQSYRIPFKFLDSDASDTDRSISSGFVGSSHEFTVFTRAYTDAISLSDTKARTLYENFYINPLKTADSLRVLKFDNKVFLKLQPFGADAVLSKLDIGIGDKYLNYYLLNDMSYLRKGGNNVSLNSAYAYAGVGGQYKKYLEWNAFGKLNFVGYEAGDFNVDGTIKVNFYPFRRARTSPLSLGGRVSTALKQPDYYEQHVYLNHYKWDNDFAKSSTTRFEAFLDIPHWDTAVDFGYGILANCIYYDSKGIIRQSDTPVNVISGTIKQNFHFGPIHLENKLLLQYSSQEEVMPLPLFSMNLRWYGEFAVVKKVMQMQIGLSCLYHTKWYAPGYNPDLGVFFNQRDYTYGNCPYIDVFVNVQWKQACIFLKVVNVNQGWPCKDQDYFSADHYIRPQRAFRIGIFWPFYVNHGNKKATSK